MRRGIILIVAALLITYVYAGALTYAVGFVAAWAFPRWWASVFGSSGTSVLAWSSFSHTVTIVLVSLPFAWLVRRIDGRLSVQVAAAVGAAIWVLFDIQAVILLFQTPRFLSIWFADTIVFLLALPSLVWLLFRRRRANGPAKTCR
jgi:hypothetical protein